MSVRLIETAGLPEGVARPAYRPADHGAGIVHLGLGAFAKAHLAAYTDDAMAAAGGDWRIIGVSLRSPLPAQELTPQNGLFTVIARDAAGSHAQVVGALARALCLTTDRAAVLAALSDPATRIVTVTVTEKGYGIDRATGGADPAHPAIAADLADPANPQGVAGLITWALARRRTEGTPPFTVLSCDNLPENGRILRGLIIDFARRTAPSMVRHIVAGVAFPSTMVDRITPARSDKTLALAETMTGRHDAAAVETEVFRQWVIEDDFPDGRPAWQAGGAIFTRDVRPYEAMKLRMLNGAHSMLAYAGFLSGHRHVRDVMADAALAALVRRHLSAAAATLPPLPGVDLDAYAQDLTRRFANPHLAHETRQIAMDGTEKLPQRLLAPACDALMRGQGMAPFAFAIAAWMRHALGHSDTGAPYDLNDPRADALRAAIACVEDPARIVARLQALPGLFPDTLAGNADWGAAVATRLAVMLRDGMPAAVAQEAMSQAEA